MRGFVFIAALLLASPAAANNPGASENSAPQGRSWFSNLFEGFGQTYGAAPRHIGPLITDPGPPSVDSIRKHLEAHDVDAALWEAERLSEASRWARDRAIGWMVRGMVHRERGEHNLASAAFTQVRTSNGPLAEFGAYYEAEQDLERGRYWVAAKECIDYRKTWPDGRFEDQCHRLQAVAYAKANAWTTAREEAKAYDSKHESAPIEEQIELTLTLTALGDEPEKMIPRLQDHAISFQAPLTGTIAEEQLAALRAQGFAEAIVPTDNRSRMLRAYSLRFTKQTHRAWEAFAELAVDSEDDPELRAWVEREATPFGWRARNWDFLAKFYRARLAEEDSPDETWSLFKVLTRGGRYAEATEVAEHGLAVHGKSRTWRGQEEEIAKAYLLEGDYVGARRHFLELAKRGGWTGLRGSYYAAFSAYMGGEDATALPELTRIVDAGGAHSDAALYWRSRLHDRNERPEEAQADRDRLQTYDESWYAVLANATSTRSNPDLDRRSGRWTGDPAPTPVTFVGEATTPGFLESITASTLPEPSSRPASTGFASMLWGSVAPARSVEVTRHPLMVDPNAPPGLGVPTSLFVHPDALGRAAKWTDKHQAGWSELRTAYDLARVGLYDLSGPLFSSIYEEWRKAYRSPSHRKHAVARRMKLQPDEWRETFNFMGDHHHAARFNHSTWKGYEDPELQRDAKLTGYPLAHARYVWAHSRENNVDPYLVLGLMRQESTYNSIARSPVGAMGAMQIMPRTGHLLANLKHDVNFTSANLEDPIFAVGYGIDYIGMLMQRFDGVYPLAIASYNGGPFNVSSWIAGTGSSMPLDEVVEHIPYRETRDYVKKVSAGYATYLSLYAPEGTLLDPHLQIRSDRPEVVDF